MADLSYVDTGIVIFVLICGIWLARGGVTSTLLGAAILVVGLWAIFNLSEYGDAILMQFWTPPVPNLFGAGLIAVVVGLFGVWITETVARIKNMLGLGMIDYMLGFGLGVFMGAVVLWGALVTARLVDVNAEEKDWWKSSEYVPLIAEYGDYLWSNQMQDLLWIIQRRYINDDENTDYQSPE